MGSNKPAYKRRHYLVRKEFQVKFMLKFCLLLFLGVIISTVTLLLFTHGTLTTSFDDSRLAIENTAFAILPSVLLTNLITLGLVSLASAVVILFVTHKIVGPMIRFEQDIMVIGQGDLTKRIRLRRTDQLNETANKINRMTESLHEKMLDIRSELEHIVGAVSEKDVPQDIVAELNSLHRKIESYFKI